MSEAHFKIAEKNKEELTCRIEYESSSGYTKRMEGLYCLRCFTPNRVGIFVEGVCVNCGNRIEERDYISDIESFLDGLDISESTKKVYESKINSGDERLTERYEEWQDDEEN